MPELTPKMSLAAWDQPLDDYDYQQLANNWNIVDFHDHTPGRGVLIPFGGLAPGAVGLAQLTSDIPLIPTGGMMLWSTSTPPEGYLLCDGAAYLITDYGDLYEVIGTTYNHSPATGYFNVPSVTLQLPVYGELCWVIKD